MCTQTGRGCPVVRAYVAEKSEDVSRSCDFALTFVGRVIWPVLATDGRK